MEPWLKISLTLTLIGFLKEFRPSEAFYYEYFVGPKNFTEDQVNREALPITVYSTLVLQVFAFLITDMCRYKPLIIVVGLSGVIMYSLMLWTTSLLGLQIALAFNGLFYGAAVAYYTYIYAKVDKEHFERVTSHTNAATLAGRTSSGILAQILVSVKWMDVEQLNYISLGAMVLTTLWACILPPVKESMYFQTEEVRHLPFSKKVVSAFVVIKGHLIQAFTNRKVIKWGMWHGFAVAGYTAMEYYIQTLYSLLQTEDQDLYNGAVIALQTFLGFCSSLLAGYVNVTWRNKLDMALAASSLVAGILTIAISQTENIFLCYSLYILNSTLVYFMTTLVMGQIAKEVVEDSYGLVVGTVTFWGQAFTAILTAVVSSEGTGFNLDVRGQFVVYGSYQFGICLIYVVIAITNFIVSKRKKSVIS
jgi:thiamine transporter 2/3